MKVRSLRCTDRDPRRGYAESRGTLSGAIARFNSTNIQAANPFVPQAVRNALPAGVTTFQLAKTFYDLGNAQFVAENKTPHIMAGVEGLAGRRMELRRPVIPGARTASATTCRTT